MKKSIILSVILLALLILTSTIFSEEKKVYSCHRLTREPILDGKVVDDPGWKNISEATDFVRLGSDSLTEKQTSFRIGYTPEALYIGMECKEPEVKEIKAELRDDDILICSEDSVEIFLFPRGADNYYHFMINTIGSRWNGKRLGGPKIPLSNWQTKTYKGEDYWSVEIKMPWEIFLNIAEKGEEWEGNFCRNILTSGDRYSCWGHLKTGFHEPENFGKIVFKDAILEEEGKETKNRIINSIRQEILTYLEPISDGEKEFSETSKQYPSLEKELTDFLKDYEKIKKAVSQLDTLSVKEASSLLKENQNLSTRFDTLKGKILQEGLWD